MGILFQMLIGWCLFGFYVLAVIAFIEMIKWIRKDFKEKRFTGICVGVFLAVLMILTVGVITVGVHNGIFCDGHHSADWNL